MKKFAYTLQEVLITMSIIGVVSALTLPMVVQEHQKKLMAATVQSTVQSLEQALSNMIEIQNKDSIYETTAWEKGGVNYSSNDTTKEFFVNEFGKYFAFSNYDTQKPSEYYGSATVYALGNNGKRTAGNVVDQFDDCIILTMKSGAVIFLRTYAKVGAAPIDEQTAISRETSLTSDPIDFFIDVNGKKAPNTVGRDLFHFYTGPNGILYPFGSKDVAKYEGNTDSDWSSGDGYLCTDSKKENNGWGCTGRLFDENYEMKY